MKEQKFWTVVTFALLLASTTWPAEAAALRPNKVTDNTVCDLSHDTNAYLSSIVLVPAVAAHKDQVDALFRLAGNFVISKCINGQVLILQGSPDISVDLPSLTELANSSCTVADVVRTETRRTVGERSKPAFELRCTITKLDQLGRKLSDLEKADPFSSLKARMYAAVADEERGLNPGAGTTAQPQNDCGKLTLGSLLRGGGCK